MDFDEAKQLLKEAIDESETSGDILRIWVDKIYQKGKQDCRKDVKESKKTKKDISLTPIIGIGLSSWQCRYCYSKINEGQKVCNSCGCGIRWWNTTIPIQTVDGKLCCDACGCGIEYGQIKCSGCGIEIDWDK